MATISGVLGASAIASREAGQQIGAAIPYALTALSNLLQDMEDRKLRRAQERRAVAREEREIAGEARAVERFEVERARRPIESQLLANQLAASQAARKQAQTDQRLSFLNIALGQVDQVRKAVAALPEEPKEGAPLEQQLQYEGAVSAVAGMIIDASRLPDNWDASLVGGEAVKEEMRQTLLNNLASAGGEIYKSAMASEFVQDLEQDPSTPIPDDPGVRQKAQDLLDIGAVQRGEAPGLTTLTDEEQRSLKIALSTSLQKRLTQVQKTVQVTPSTVLKPPGAPPEPVDVTGRILPETPPIGSMEPFEPTLDQRIGEAFTRARYPDFPADMLPGATIETQIPSRVPGSTMLESQVIDIPMLVNLGAQIQRLGVSDQALQNVILRRARGEDLADIVEAEGLRIPPKQVKTIMGRQETLRKALEGR